jgi:hypothetical protein
MVQVNAESLSDALIFKVTVQPDFQYPDHPG